MCCLQLLGLVSTIPYLLLFLMPVYGSFYGKESVLRMSIFLMGQSVTTSIISKYMLLADPLIQLALLAVFVSVRFTIIPGPLVWLLDKVMFVSEPIWQIFEALGVVFLTMEISQEAADHIDDEPALAKGFILSLSGVCYAFSAYLFWSIINTDLTFYIWAAVLVLVVSLVVHMIVVKHDSGILSDAAVIGACSIAMAYDATQSKITAKTEIDIPNTWSEYTSDHSYIQMMFQIILTGLDSSTHALHCFARMLSPWFVMTTLARICCILYAIGLIKILLSKMAEKSQEESTLEDSLNLDFDDDSEIPATLALTHSPLLVKLVVIFVYTQFLICHVNIYHLNNTWLSWLQSWFPSGRWLQIVLLNVYYLYRLHTSNEYSDF